MGGYGTWELGLAHPERFAAIAPICGGGNFATMFVANANQTLRAAAASGCGLFHGAKDDLVPLTESQAARRRAENEQGG